MLKKGW